MDTKIPRRQYSVQIVDSRTERVEPTLRLLREAGYEPKYFSHYEELKRQAATQPPHVVVFHRSDEGQGVATALTELRAILPETHFVILSSAAGLAATWREWGEIIYDCLLSPPVHPMQLVRAIDRAAERDTYMYKAEDLQAKLVQAHPQMEMQNEPTVIEKTFQPMPPIDEPEPTFRVSLDELKEETEQFMASVLREVEMAAEIHPNPNALLGEDQEGGAQLLEADRTGENFWAIWMQLIKCRQLDELLREGLNVLTPLAKKSPAIFLKYLPNRRALVALAGTQLAAEKWQGLGLELSQEPDFRAGDLRLPIKLTGLRDLAHAVAGNENVWARPIVLRDEVYGLYVLFSDPLELDLKRIEPILHLIEERSQLLDLQQYMHSLEIHDPGTALLNRASFQVRMAGEIARARRLNLPVSLLLISLDQYRDLVKVYGIEEAQMALRALGKIIGPRIRINDVLARVSPEDLALLLPHTPSDGAAIKAERIRRLIEAADFSRLLPKFPKLTVSVGVSEYPSLCRDGDDLFNTADDALWQVKNKICNKVCLAASIPGFVPDFLVGRT